MYAEREREREREREQIAQSQCNAREMLGHKPIGDGFPVCIVFEAGATHYGLESALALVDMAVESKADAVKFQMVNVERLIPDASVMFEYQWLADKATKRVETITESLKEILKRRELKRAEWSKLIGYCKKRGILFFSTATHADEMAFLAENGADCIKIASADITFHHLLREAARYPWIVQIDTGNATIGEVEQAVDVLESAGTSRIIINHCPSGYPARLDAINLRVIQTLKTMFPYPVAFSDHSPGHDMDIAAIALGANMLEKTITLDKGIRSPEHIMSLEPQEGADFVRTVRQVEQALGKGRRPKTPEMVKSTLRGRRSIVAARDLAKGTVIAQEDLAYTRPGTGIQAQFDPLVLGRTLRHPIKAGQQLAWADLA